MNKQSNSNLTYLNSLDQNPLRELLESFFSGRNASTLKAYKADLDDFRQFLNEVSTENAIEFLLSHGHGHANKVALSYKAYMTDSGLQSSTTCRRLSSLRSLVALARTIGIVPYKLEIKNPKVEAYRDTRGPGKPNIELMLLEVKKKRNIKSIRDYAVLRLLYDLGLRASEVINLDIEDFDSQRSVLLVLRKGKSQKILLSLPEPTKKALEQWAKKRCVFPSSCNALFVSMDRSNKGKSKRLTRNGLYDLIRAIGKRVDIKVHPHAIRHTSITEAIKEAKKRGLGLDDVLDHSGHSNVQTLMIYNDREVDMQGKISSIIANTIKVPK